MMEVDKAREIVSVGGASTLGKRQDHTTGRSEKG
jgi:hypothetical protein